MSFIDNIIVVFVVIIFLHLLSNNNNAFQRTNILNPRQTIARPIQQRHINRNVKKRTITTTNKNRPMYRQGAYGTTTNGITTDNNNNPTSTFSNGMNTITPLAPIGRLFNNQSLQLVLSNLASPVDVTFTTSEPDNLYIVDQTGIIYQYNLQTGALTTFLDISNEIVPLNPNYDERGLLGMAFHPQYAQNGKFYLYYSRPAGEMTDNVLVEYNRDRTRTPRVLLSLVKQQPYHNGGSVLFGPDGYLFLTSGDGGIQVRV
jgi:hypothetical protein